MKYSHPVMPISTVWLVYSTLDGGQYFGGVSVMVVAFIALSLSLFFAITYPVTKQHYIKKYETFFPVLAYTIYLVNMYARITQYTFLSKEYTLYSYLFFVVALFIYSVVVIIRLKGDARLIFLHPCAATAIILCTFLL